MGKRKRTSDHNRIQHSSDTVPCSSGMELLSEEKGLHAIDSSELKPISSSVLDVADSSMKLQNAHHPSTGHHHQSLGRSLFLKRSRHHYAHQYSRRGSANLANPSTSRGKVTSLRDDKLSFKLAAQCNSELGRHSEFREKAFFRPERIRSRSLVPDTVSTDLAKTICVICQKPLGRKLFFPGISTSSVELSVVAVLACGHLYHADCLEPKTSFEEIRDPPCPACTGLLSQVDDEREQD
ncbi:43kDa postsynaptic protein [Parasponia andersonii]|uniref:43kDa postsynaptic protein n=1 Tax=Parasponia andersonii TaxID=3476 RepID=A0A2P5D5I0_PARAD|nr:43kDa postsynaptic protein [Parasponia andersonii]